MGLRLTIRVLTVVPRYPMPPHRGQQTGTTRHDSDRGVPWVGVLSLGSWIPITMRIPRPELIVCLLLLCALVIGWLGSERRQVRMDSPQDRLTALTERMAAERLPSRVPTVATQGSTPPAATLPKHPAITGEFVLVSGRVVVTDPGYDLETAEIPGLGATCDACANGIWSVRTTSRSLDGRISAPDPDELIAVHQSVASLAEETALKWETLSDSISGDHAMIGVYDRAHFHDDGIIPRNYVWKFGPTGSPADPNDLWYSYNCEVIPRGFGAAVLPYGCVLHWDGGVRVSVARDKAGQVVVIRFKTEH